MDSPKKSDELKKLESHMIVNKSKSNSSNLFIVLRYSDWVDILLMILGTIGAIGDGMSTNILLVFASRIMNSLGYGNTQQNRGNFMDEVEKCSLNFVYLGLVVLVVAFMEGYCWSKTSERQVMRMRYKYLEAVLRQEVGFFDSQEATTSEVINSISKDTSLIQEVLSEKVPTFVMHSSVFVSGLAFATMFSWRLSVAAFPTLLLLIIPGLIYGKYLLRLSRRAHEEYGTANGIVEQALSSIRTIYAFTAEKRVVERYSAVLDRTIRLGMKQGLAKGLAVGSTGLSFAIWAFLAWYGSRLVMYNGESGGRIYAAAISFVLSGLSLGTALPDVKYFTEAAIAAQRIFERIDRKPSIDGEDDHKGLVPETIRGELHFDHVKFAYPSRPDSPVLADFSLKIDPGKTVALVGASGSGKSTAVALALRFYDPDSGAIRIDGLDVRSLRLKWVRAQMGLVSQDHALFGTSIRDNILFGKLDASVDELTAASVAANAHSFITQLPEGYETKVGDRGGLLSGGQKQRIAIARAIIRNPVILLLDEATSALDSESETLVQNALDQASMGRTTLVVAHKLSTVRNADLIAVVSSGSVIELGSHNELISRPNGHYAKLAKMQRQFSSFLDRPDDDFVVHPPSTARSSPMLSAKSPELLAAAVKSPAVISPPPPSFRRLLALNAPEWKQGLAGAVSAAAFGSVQPTYALTIGGMISAFFAPTHDEIRARIRTYSMIFSALTAASVTLNLAQHCSFAYMGERLTRRVRVRMLESILTFEPAWFDEEHNSSGALCSRLDTEASMVKSLVADRASLVVQTTSAVAVAVAMGLIVAWKLAVVMVAVQPLTIACFYARKVMLSRASAEAARDQGRSAQAAAEAVRNHRIVTAFGSSGEVLRLFAAAQEGARKEGARRAWLAGAGMGSAQCLTFMTWALDFWFGGRLVERGQISAGDVFKTFFILVSTGKVIAEAGSMTSDLAKGSAAVSSVFHILDRRSLISPSINNGCNADGAKLEKIVGGIEMKKVEFAYPSRPHAPILRQLSLEVRAGTSIGVVGKSGCGKSTVISLILRFYDVDKGSVKVDGVDIRDLDIQWLRKHTALVSQEPVIYSGTIQQNIAFGNPNASDDEVYKAARAANAHNFISSLKDGYETECGEGGVQLSGGQKQRIAIARAIIRNPTILLLDEATSALDAQSEQVVQEALDRIMVGRTTIVVAHRLNTIKHLDSIAVLAEGKVVERGTYAQLKHNKGAFFNLLNLPNLSPSH